MSQSLAHFSSQIDEAASKSGGVVGVREQGPDREEAPLRVDHSNALRRKTTSDRRTQPDQTRAGKTSGKEQLLGRGVSFKSRYRTLENL